MADLNDFCVGSVYVANARRVSWKNQAENECFWPGLCFGGSTASEHLFDTCAQKQLKGRGFLLLDSFLRCDTSNKIMKKLVASVGLVAIGTSGLQADTISGTVTDQSKPWSVSATLRGFYDDNVNTVHTDVRDSFGFEINPAVGVFTQWEGTRLGASYQYSFKYYDRKPLGNTDNYDQTHTFDIGLTHAFSPRYNLSVSDSFAIGQEPDVLRAGNAFSTFQRISGDNIRNYGNLTFTAQLTPLWGLEFGYGNTFFDYDNEGGNADQPSQSGLLDRIEHAVHIDGRWTVQPQTVAVVGYQFRQVNYTGDEEIGILEDGTSIRSDNRDSRSHYIYIGADHTFLPSLVGSIRAGGRYIDYYKETSGGIGNDIGPYVNMTLSYGYAPQSYIEAGFSYDMNATDAFSVQGNSYTQNEESAVLHASINHRITPKLFGSVLSSFQYSTFNGGSLNNESERYFLLGLNLKYHFTPHFSAEAGYNYDLVNSDVSERSFDRNRVYLGVTAAY